MHSAILDPATDEAIADAVEAWLAIDGNPFLRAVLHRETARSIQLAVSA